mgnify:CR=1 FL=1
MEEEHRLEQVHSSVYEKLAKLKTYKKIRDYLASFGCTKGEQSRIIRQYKKSKFYRGDLVLLPLPKDGEL